MNFILWVGLVLTISLTASANSISGSLDKTFGRNGVQLVDQGFPNIKQREIFLDSEGRIYVVQTLLLLQNSVVVESSDEYLVARLTPDGSQLDLSYGDHGLFMIKLVNQLGNMAYLGSTITPDGKIVLASEEYQIISQNGNITIAAAKVAHLYQVDDTGRLDSSFGHNGEQTIQRPFWTATITATSHGLVLSGVDPEEQAIYTYHILPNGSLDDYADAPLGTLKMYQLAASAASNGDNYFAGYRFNPSDDADWGAAIVRTTADGTLDKAFGTNGVWTAPTKRWSAIAVHGQADKAVFVTLGFTNGLIDQRFCKLTSAGAPDFSFADHGCLAFGANVSEVAKNLLFLPDNTMILNFVGSDANLKLLRIDQSGVPLKNFGINGVVDEAAVLKSEGHTFAAGGLAFQQNPQRILEGITIFKWMAPGAIQAIVP